MGCTHLNFDANAIDYRKCLSKPTAPGAMQPPAMRDDCSAIPQNYTTALQVLEEEIGPTTMKIFQEVRDANEDPPSGESGLYSVWLKVFEKAAGHLSSSPVVPSVSSENVASETVAVAGTSGTSSETAAGTSSTSSETVAGPEGSATCTDLPMSEPAVSVQVAEVPMAPLASSFTEAAATAEGIAGSMSAALPSCTLSEGADMDITQGDFSKHLYWPKSPENRKKTQRESSICRLIKKVA